MTDGRSKVQVGYHSLSATDGFIRSITGRTEIHRSIEGDTHVRHLITGRTQIS